MRTFGIYLAGALFLAAALLLIALLLAGHELSHAEPLLIGGFAALLIGYGGLVYDLAANGRLLRRNSPFIVILFLGALAMAGAILTR